MNSRCPLIDDTAGRDYFVEERSPTDVSQDRRVVADCLNHRLRIPLRRRKHTGELGVVVAAESLGKDSKVHIRIRARLATGVRTKEYDPLDRHAAPFEFSRVRADAA